MFQIRACPPSLILQKYPERISSTITNVIDVKNPIKIALVIAFWTPFAEDTWAPILRREATRGADGIGGSLFLIPRLRLVVVVLTVRSAVSAVEVGTPLGSLTVTEDLRLRA